MRSTSVWIIFRLYLSIFTYLLEPYESFFVINNNSTCHKKVVLIMVLNLDYLVRVSSFYLMRPFLLLLPASTPPFVSQKVGQTEKPGDIYYNHVSEILVIVNIRNYLMSGSVSLLRFIYAVHGGIFWLVDTSFYSLF